MSKSCSKSIYRVRSLYHGYIYFLFFLTFFFAVTIWVLILIVTNTRRFIPYIQIFYNLSLIIFDLFVFSFAIIVFILPNRFWKTRFLRIFFSLNNIFCLYFLNQGWVVTFIRNQSKLYWRWTRRNQWLRFIRWCEWCMLLWNLFSC